MGRFQEELLARVERFADRVLDVARAIEQAEAPRRVVDQLIGSGTSVGANTFEADEAMSRADFCRILAIILKELNETRFWLRLIARRGWVPPSRLESLEHEARELKLVFGAILSRTRANDR